VKGKPLLDQCSGGSVRESCCASRPVMERLLLFSCRQSIHQPGLPNLALNEQHNPVRLRRSHTHTHTHTHSQQIIFLFIFFFFLKSRKIPPFFASLCLTCSCTLSCLLLQSVMPGTGYIYVYIYIYSYMYTYILT